MNTTLRAEYQRIRRSTPSTPAKSALAWARGTTQAAARPEYPWKNDKRTGNPVAKFSTEGFDVVITFVYDQDSERDWLGDLAAVKRDECTDYPAGKPSPDAVMVTNDRGERAWFTSAYGYEQHVKDAIAMGYSRGTAVDWARKCVREDAKQRISDDPLYGCVVKVYRAGVLLGESSVWAIDVDGYIDSPPNLAYRDEVASEQLPEALDAARKALAELGGEVPATQYPPLEASR
jgi:hypothetical protein